MVGNYLFDFVISQWIHRKCCLSQKIGQKQHPAAPIRIYYCENLPTGVVHDSTSDHPWPYHHPR